MTAPAVGRGAAVRFLAVADLGHAETDGSAEIDHDQAKDMINYTPVDTLQYVSHPRLTPLPESDIGHCVTLLFWSRRAV